MSLSVWFSGIALLLTFTLLLSQALFRVGHLSARVEALEAWRINMRQDLHEISDKLEFMSNQMLGLQTLIEERTEKRRFARETLS
jgi:hypothetical protein